MNPKTLRYFVPFFALLLLFENGCKDHDSVDDLPTCVREEIYNILRAEVRNPPGSVWQYSYKGKTVFYIPPYCCDIPSQLFDDQCNFICSPDGGITGAGDGRCNDFFCLRTDGILIWRDTR